VSELRDRLFAASPEALGELCERHRDAIVAEFRDWLVLPEPLRRDMAATQAYVGAVMRIAEQLAAAGEPRPLGWLGGEDRDDPVAGWQAQLANAQALTEAGRPDAAVGVLGALLDSLDEAGGPLVDDLATRARGALSAALLDLGDTGGARAYARAAQDACIASFDLDGIRTYAENLDLLDALAAGPELEALREGLAEAQDLSDAGRYAASNELLHELAGHDDIDRYAGKLCGLMGLNLFRLGDVDGARSWTEAALRSCDAADDLYGMTIYAENLQVIDRVAPAPA
jgi:hypothetical protein